MATYSSVFSSGWATLILNVTTESYSIANNTSYLKCVLQIRKDKTASSYNLSSASISMVVNGSTLYSSKSFDIRSLAVGSTQTLSTNYITVSHNVDGTKSVSCSASFTSGVRLGSASLSGVYVCDTIPRQATITGAPDFNDEQNPTITYSNPAGNAVTALDACISFTGAKDDIGYRAISKTDTNYTFNLTEAERKTLRQWVTAGSTSRAVTFFVRTNIGGTYHHSTISKTLTIINDAPVLNSTVTITDNLTKDLTGNSDTIIKGVSTVDYAINATAYKEASINGQWVLNNGVYKYESTGTFTNLQSGYFLFAASDNRGRHIRDEVTMNVVDYVKLTCGFNHNIAFVEGAENNKINISININGSYFNGTFGAIDNDITLAYRYKVNNGDWCDWIHPITDMSLNPTFNGNTYSMNFVALSNVDYKDTYTFQCAASDKLAYVESSEYPIKVLPVFDWGEDDFNFNVPVHSKGGFTYDIPIKNYVSVDDMLTSGKYYMGALATNKPGNGYNGWLEVYTLSDGYYVYQKYIDHLGNKYERWRKDGVWEQWIRVVTDTTIRLLPPGNAKDGSYWRGMYSGTYWYDSSRTAVDNMPNHYGFVLVMVMGSDFSVLFFTQASGAIYRISGNSGTISDWVAI